jgi:hypothetical protein
MLVSVGRSFTRFIHRATVAVSSHSRICCNGFNGLYHFGSILFGKEKSHSDEEKTGHD